jgi:hypothetical protein
MVGGRFLMSIWKAGVKTSIMVGMGINLFAAPLHVETACRFLNPKECDNQHDVHTESTTAIGSYNLHYKDTILTNVNTLNPSGTPAQRPEFMKRIYFESEENKFNTEVVIISFSEPK